MFRIKICGVVGLTDVDAVADAGADAVGLNFFPPSIRHVTSEQGKTLAQHALQRDLIRVGVFVNESVERILHLRRHVGLDLIQLHGQESVEEVTRLVDASCPVLRVVRLPTGTLDPCEIERRVAPWRGLGCPILFDAEVGVIGGGVGARIDWENLGHWAEFFSLQVRWGLAGGLEPETVSQAIRLTRATCVDVASGVEEPRGTKSPPRIVSFVKAAAAAWDLSIPANATTGLGPSSI